MFGFGKHNVVTDEKEVKEVVDRALLFLQKKINYIPTITRMEYEHTKRPVEILDLFDDFYSEIYCVLYDENPMDLPHVDHDISRVMNAQIQDYSYIFQGDLSVQIHIAPVVFRGKKGIMMHQVDCLKCFPKDGGEMTGLVKAKFLAFEEDGSSALGLHQIWKLTDHAYDHHTEGEDFYTSYSGVTFNW